MQTTKPQPETVSADNQKASTPQPAAGYFHGLPVSEKMIASWAEFFWSETYGDLANLRDGVNYDLHVYIAFGTPTLALENQMTEVARTGETICAPLIRCRAELPEWADGSDEAQECMNDNAKTETIEAWENEIRANLDQLEINVVDIDAIDGTPSRHANIVIPGTEFGFSIDAENQVWGAFPDDNQPGWDAAVEAAGLLEMSTGQMEAFLLSILLADCPDFFGCEND